MGNPYTSPETIVSNENIRVVELLVRYKYQLKVVNMLRAEGMDYEDARRLVSNNVQAAQSALDLDNRFWKIAAIIFLVLSMTLLFLIIYHSAYIHYIAVGFLCLFAGGSVTAFRRCEKIKF